MDKVKARLIELNASGAEAPEWVHLLPAGRLTTVDGVEYLVDQAALAQIMASQSAHGADLVIDYEHQTHEGGQAPAAGWVKELAARPDGLWGRVQWTERGRAYVANREYRYLSPVLWVEVDSRRVVGLTDLALTNVPRIDNFPPILNKGDVSMNWLERLRKALALGPEAGESQVLEATEQAINSGRGLLATLRTLVGLDDKAEPQKVLEAVKVEVNKAKAAPPAGVTAIPNSLLEALKLRPGAGESEALGAIRGLAEGSAQLAQMQGRLADLERAEVERQANRLVDRGLKEGKITPATKDQVLAWAKTDPKGCEAYLNVAPVVVPMGGLPKAPQRQAAGGAPEGVQAEVNSMLGISPEVFKKHNPASEEV
ncbi:MAG: hypothetical protein HY794_13335 [Desulfarculus sp.]|nr:hypothetical protein [Desulfarculus sp.]